MATGVVVSAQPAGESSDPVLDELAEAAEADEELFRPMGAETAEPAESDTDPDVPIDLRMNWKAVSLRRAHPGPGRTAELIPVLIASTVTPFALNGRRPPLISMLDYEVGLVKPGRAQTVGIFPDSATLTRASMGKVTFGIDVKGNISFPSAALAAVLPALPLLPLLPGLKLQMSADGTFQVGAFTITAVQIIASDISDAGAKWQLYRVGQELAQAHYLFHVIHAPASARRFRIQAKTAVTCRTWYGKHSPTKLWRAEPVVHTIDREDLDWE
jgi:hypothetical protein